MASNIERQREKILNGNLWKVIIFITLPIAFYNLVQSMYSLLDVYLSTHIGETEVVAVSFTGSINQIILSVGNGLSVAATTLIAVAIGKKDYFKAKRYMTQILLISLFISIVIILFGFTFSDLLLKMAGAGKTDNPDLLPVAKLYFRLNLIASPIVLLQITYVAIKRAQGDSKLIVKLLWVSMCVKILSGILFVVVLQLGIYGLFFSTTLSQLIFVLFSIYEYFIEDTPLKLNIKDLVFKYKEIVLIFMLGLPLAIENSTLQLGHIIVNANVLEFGDNFFAAYTYANKINSLGLGFLSGLGVGVVPIIAQNLAVKNYARVKQTIKYGCLVALFLALPIYLFFLITPHLLVGIFQITSEESLKETIKGLRIISIGLIPWGQYHIASAVFQAYGKTRYNLLISLIRLYAFRVGLVYLLIHILKLGKIGIWYSVGISNVLGFIFIWILLYLMFKYNRRDEIKI